ncbi:hypothetical protein KF840_09320 [bacterium]|nr:hypothetical protein [bacterium]
MVAYRGDVEPHHRRFLILEQGIGSAVFNLLLNAVIAWALFHHLEAVPLWGQESIAGDTLGTCFFLPFFTALTVTPLVRRRIAKGGLAALDWTRESHALLTWLPAGTFRRALAIGALSLLVVGPLAVLSLHGLAVAALAFPSFVAFKAVFAALLGMLVTPVISIWALAEPARARAPVSY